MGLKTKRFWDKVGGVLRKIKFSLQKIKWRIVIPILILIVLIATIILKPYHPAHSLFLKYLSTILSWPTVVFILIIFFCLIFREQISVLLGKISEIGFGSASLRIGQKPVEAGMEKAVREASFRKRDEVDASQTEQLPEKFEDIPQPYQKLARTYVDWIICERLIRWMYRSQFELLRALVVKGSLSSVEIKQFYDLYLQRGGNPNYTQDAYIDWLVAVNLGERAASDKTSLVPTDHGKKFIEYFYMNKYPESEFKPI